MEAERKDLKIALLTCKVDMLEKLNEKNEKMIEKNEKMNEKNEKMIEQNQKMNEKNEQMMIDAKVRYNEKELALHHSQGKLRCRNIIESFETAFDLKLHENGGRKKAWIKWLKGDSVTAQKLRNVFEACKFEGGHSCECVANYVSSLYQTLSQEIHHPSVATMIGFEIPIPYNLSQENERLLKSIAHVGLNWDVTFIRIQVNTDNSTENS